MGCCKARQWGWTATTNTSKADQLPVSMHALPETQCIQCLLTRFSATDHHNDAQQRSNHEQAGGSAHLGDKCPTLDDDTELNICSDLIKCVPCLSSGITISTGYRIIPLGPTEVLAIAAVLPRSRAVTTRWAVCRKSESMFFYSTFA
jgi:hypothetical protein